MTIEEREAEALAFCEGIAGDRTFLVGLHVGFKPLFKQKGITRITERIKWFNKPPRSDKGKLPYDSRYDNPASISAMGNQSNRDNRRLSE